MRRMRGDDPLSSSADLIFVKFIAKSAGNFAMEWRSRGRGFKSALLHHPVSRFSDITENRSKSARVRARFAITRGPGECLRVGPNRQNRPKTYPGAIYARSADHRLRFATSSSLRSVVITSAATVAPVGSEALPRLPLWLDILVNVKQRQHGVIARQAAGLF